MIGGEPEEDIFGMDADRGYIDALKDRIVDAVRLAVEAGRTTSDGRPEVKAIEEILGRDISAADRDAAWEAYQADQTSGAEE